MTGPEHYREAERLLSEEGQVSEFKLVHLARAQVHATLALAAAVATDPAHMAVGRDLHKAWAIAGDMAVGRLS